MRYIEKECVITLEEFERLNKTFLKHFNQPDVDESTDKNNILSDEEE